MRRCRKPFIDDRKHTSKAVHALLFYLIFFGILTARISSAAPLFYDPLTIEGLTVYRDHKRSDLFYHAPEEMVLKIQEGRPIFQFTLIGYLGSSRTQDQGIFKDKGILNFTVQENLSPEKIDHMQKILRKENHPSALLKRLPIRGISAQLIYERVSDGESLRKGSLTTLAVEDSGDESEPTSQYSDIWREKSFIIALEDLDSNFFWNAFQDEQLVLSLSYTHTVDGLDEKEGEQIPSQRHLAGSLPIRVSPEKYPELFKQIDLGAKMTIGYMHLDIYCFDFVNQAVPNLYSKIVEVRYEDLSGKPVITQVEFNKKERTYKHSLDFRYAKKLNKSYDYRVLLINKDGEMKEQSWIRDNADSFLDITTYQDNRRSVQEKGDVSQKNLY